MKLSNPRIIIAIFGVFAIAIKAQASDPERQLRYRLEPLDEGEDFEDGLVQEESEGRDLASNGPTLKCKAWPDSDVVTNGQTIGVTWKVQNEGDVPVLLRRLTIVGATKYIGAAKKILPGICGTKTTVASGQEYMCESDITFANLVDGQRLRVAMEAKALKNGKNVKCRSSWKVVADDDCGRV